MAGKLEILVTDNDDGEIAAVVNGKQARTWPYNGVGQRRMKVKFAREYVEGFCDGFDYANKQEK